MAVSEDYLNYLKDQLSGFGEIEIKKMFGGLGFFKEGLMFGMVGNDSFRLKVDSTNEQDYISKGMTPYHSGSKKKGMPYWEVPADILDSKSELCLWAKKSYEIAKSAAEKK
ncbi:MAG: hypothetical protein DHS20C17_19640 [Cyclobacteriaceae bacterium]|nr:MAG: hypothetical protein DHS20C17_19640 [Cyclobacteriaceae bacterium]